MELDDFLYTSAGRGRYACFTGTNRLMFITHRTNKYTELDEAALSCPSPVPQHPKFIRFPSRRSALLLFRTKFQFFCRKDLHCPAFSAIIHVVADADVAQSVERILGKDMFYATQQYIYSRALI